jgi:hypothetical protein
VITPAGFGQEVAGPGSATDAALFTWLGKGAVTPVAAAAATSPHAARRVLCRRNRRHEPRYCNGQCRRAVSMMRSPVLIMTTAGHLAGFCLFRGTCVRRFPPECLDPH